MAETPSITEQNENLQLQAYERIREGILYARYAPGSKLMARDLCQDLDMGRTPVREALVRLRQEGLVDVVPQSGTYVSKISLRSVECARYVREHLERQVAVECCSRSSEKDYRQLVTLIREQKRALDESDRRAFFDGDSLMHKTMFEIAGRARVWDWLEILSIDLNRYRWLRMQTEELDWSSIMDQHYAICDALADRNADETEYLISSHLHLLFVENATVIRAFPDYFLMDR